jgi:hypothetical protein
MTKVLGVRSNEKIARSEPKYCKTTTRGVVIQIIYSRQRSQSQVCVVWTDQDVDLCSPARSLCSLHISYCGVRARPIELVDVAADEVGLHV